MKQRKHRRGTWVAALGLVLMLLGAFVLELSGDTMQFVFPVQAENEQEEALSAVYEAGMEQLASIGDSLSAYAIAARQQGASIASGKGKSAQVTVYAVGEGYFDVMHETLREGRFISGTDVSRADNVIVIEEKTAIALFPGVEPVGQELEIDGIAYEVAGVIAGGRKLGESDEAVAYIPITAAGKNGMQVQTAACVAKGVDMIGSAILMEDTLAVWQPLGSFYNLQKMRLGAAMPLRWVILIAGICLLLTVLQRLNAWLMGRIGFYHEQLKTRYARAMAPGMAGSALLAGLLYGLWLLAVSGLAVFSIEPLYVFTEWVPEVVVELSSLQSRFWTLNNAHAQAVRCITREAAVCQLGEGLMQWGLMAVLLGAALRGGKWINQEADMPALNRDR